MKRVALSIGCFLLAVNAPFLQTKSPIEGVWKITEVRWSRAQPAARQGAVVSSPQPGLMIFTRGYYRTVEVRDGGQQPRAAAAAGYAYAMRPLRYSINITLDGCCDHRETPAHALDQRLMETHPVVRTMSQRATRSEPVGDAETFAISVSGRRTEFR